MQILKLFFFLSDISSIITICFSCHVFVICIDFYHFFPRLYDSRICSFYLLLFVLHFPSLYIIIIKCFLLRCYDLISCILYCCSTYSSFHRFIGNVTSVTCVVPLLMSFSWYLRCRCDQVLEKTFFLFTCAICTKFTFSFVSIPSFELWFFNLFRHFSSILNDSY